MKLISQRANLLLTSKGKTQSPTGKQAKDVNRHFSKGDIQMANRYMKRCSVSLVREKQVKTTVRHHFTSTRVTVIEKTDSNKYW